MQRHPVFAPGPAIVPTGQYVEVRRLELGSGDTRQVIYRKTFKGQGWDVWNDRENRLLNLFAARKGGPVVQMHSFTAATPGVLSALETFDAGVTIADWLTVSAAYADGAVLPHPFSRGEDFLRLMRACLKALHYIHDIGVVHCDIKANNICIPFLPGVFVEGMRVRPDFDNIRLIDFSFSLWPELPLETALPIAPEGEAANYLSPLLRKALRQDQNGQSVLALNKLDYRVDFFSLGYMLQDIRDRGRLHWDTEPRGVSGEALVQTLLDELQEIGSGHSGLLGRFMGGPAHERLIKRLDGWLKDARPTRPFTPGNRKEQAPTPDFTPMLADSQRHTPVATPLATPVAQPLAPPAHAPHASRHPAHQAANLNPAATHAASPLPDPISHDRRPNLLQKFLASYVVILALIGGGALYLWWSKSPPEGKTGAARVTEPVKKADKDSTDKSNKTQPPIKPPQPTVPARARDLVKNLLAAGGNEDRFDRLMPHDADSDKVISQAYYQLKAQWLNPVQKDREAALAPLLFLLEEQDDGEQAKARGQLGARYWRDSETGIMRSRWWTAPGAMPADDAARNWLRRTRLLAKAEVFSARIAAAEAQFAGKGMTADRIGAGNALSEAFRALEEDDLNGQEAAALRDGVTMVKLGLAYPEGGFAQAVRPGLEHLADLQHANASFLLGSLYLCRQSPANKDAARQTFIRLRNLAQAKGAKEHAERAQDVLHKLDVGENPCAWLGMGGKL